MKEQIPSALQSAREMGNEGEILCIVNPYRSKKIVYLAPINSLENLTPTKWLKLDLANIVSIKNISTTRYLGALLPVALVKLDSYQSSRDARTPAGLDLKIKAIDSQSLNEVYTTPFNFTGLPLRSTDGDVVLQSISGWFSSDGRYRCEATGYYDSFWGDTYRLTFFLKRDQAVIFSTYHQPTYSTHDDIREVYEGQDNAVRVNYFQINYVQFQILDV